jgi:hypothetical protein
MFRVFSKFNPLFFRPRIRAAIAQFQADLIKHVRDAVQMLQVRPSSRPQAQGSYPPPRPSPVGRPGRGRV